MASPPKLTDAQRKAALEKAAEARKVRAELKARIKMGWGAYLLTTPQKLT